MPSLSMFGKKKTKLEKRILALELTVTNLELGKGKKNGRYQPFCQLTDRKGRVLGRSMVLFDCCVSARWPPIKMNWESMLHHHMNQGTVSVSCAPRQNKRPIREDRTKLSSLNEAALHNLEETVMTEPVLISIYDFRRDGQHVILGQIHTSFHELDEMATQIESNDLTRSTFLANKNLGGPPKEPSFRLSDISLAQLLVKRFHHSSNGKADALLPGNFTDSKLRHVATPRGIPAKEQRDDSSWQIKAVKSFSSLTTSDETLPTECSSRWGDDNESYRWTSPKELTQQCPHVFEVAVGSSPASSRKMLFALDRLCALGGMANETNPTDNTTLAIPAKSAEHSMTKPMSQNELTASLIGLSKSKLRQLTELRALSVEGALPPAQAQQFQVLARLLDSFESEVKQHEAIEHRCKQYQQQVGRGNSQPNQRPFLSNRVTMKHQLKRTEHVVQALASKCVEQQKGGQFKAFLVLLERLEKEKSNETKSELERRKARTVQRGLSTMALAKEIKNKLSQLERVRIESADDSMDEEEVESATVVTSVSIEMQPPTAAEQSEALHGLLKKLEGHQILLKEDFKRHHAALQRERDKEKQGIEQALPEQLNIKLRRMEGVIEKLSSTVLSPREEAKQVQFFIKLLDSCDDEDETVEEIEANLHEHLNPMPDKGLNESLIRGLSFKLQHMEHASATQDSYDYEQEGTGGSATTESQAQMLARLLQRLEGHEARQRQEAVQQRERAKMMMIRNETSSSVETRCLVC